ncbi:MAG: alpha-amylase family glycosyl hydrolase [Chthoniobacter sp.]|nr:alpha-amylase family glycosyl hydrolase [Chthoniobacter sp.]
MERVRIYQLLPRLFGNTNETRRSNGTLAENGVGKFADIDDAALASLLALGFTHLWLTGVLRQATGTDYSAIGLPADDPDLLKGLAGSPYAITDYFDVCPDYALDPARRLGEFKALLQRIHAHGLRVIIDFVANHVARSYDSRIRPDLNFGGRDDRGKFFDPRNNFFYLQADSPGGGPPLRLPTFADGRALSPTCRVLGGCDGRFDGERDHGKVTGNNAATWAPGIWDWYETVKLNYGYDFTTGARQYPTAEEPHQPVPDTWLKMDAVLAYWQEMGVDGFRCDMAHMVPPEFWQWVVARARARQPEVFLAGEAYDNDPMKVGRGNVLHDLLAAGFDAVYDDPSYKILKGIYDGPKWANDLDGIAGDTGLFTRSLRYAENHDEVRLAGAGQWGGIGMQVGRPVSAILFGLSQGPVLLYSGQEVGEPAQGAEGFGADDARTTIFDYWSMPELAKWVNDHRYDGGRLSAEQADLRAFYARLLALVNEPAFRDGGFFALNSANVGNTRYGRLPGEGASGHWLYAFLRYDAASDQRFLVLVNLHRGENFRDVGVWLPHAALEFLQVPVGSAWQFRERLGSQPGSAVAAAVPGADGVMLQITECTPLSACYFEWLRASIPHSAP